MADFEPIKIPFEIPVAEIAKDTERVQESFADTDKSVARAEAKFNSWVKSQLQGAKATGSNVQVTKQYTSVLATLERRMKMAQDPKLVQAYANSIAKLKNEVNALGSRATALQPIRRQFDGLGHSINMITRDLPAFTYGPQMGFLGISNNLAPLADQIARLVRQNKELLAQGMKTTPVWRQVLKSLFSWQTALSAGILLLTLYGKEIGEWIGSLFKGEKAVSAVKMRIDALNAAFKSSKVKKARKDILELKATFASAEKGIISKDKALKEYNKTLGKLAGKTDSYAKAERTLMNQSDEYLKMLTYKQAAYAALDAANDKIISNEQKRLNLDKDLERAEENIKKFKGLSYTSGVIVSQFGVSTTSPIAKADAKLHAAKMAVAAIREEKKNLEDTSVATFNNLMKNAKEIAEKNNFKLFSESDTEEDAGKILNSRKQLLDKIAALDSEYARKSFAKDKQELQALRDKFDKIRQEVAKFNKNPKNKVKIASSQLDTIQKSAESDLVYRQETKSLEKTLAQKKKLYAAYEIYKTKVGKEAADKRYKDSLGEVKNYEDFLNAELSKLQNGNELSGVEKERLKVLLTAQNQYNNEQQQLYEEQLADLVSYEQKRKALVEQFDEDYQKLLDDGQLEAAKVLKERHEQTLGELDNAQLEKLDTYKVLFDGIMRLSVKELKVVLANAKKMLQLEKLSAELRAKILRQIKEVEGLLNAKELDDISLITKKVGELGGAFSELGKSIGNSGLAEVGGLLSGLASNVDNVLVAFDKSASKTDRISAGISGVITVIDTIASASAQRRKAEEDYYYSVLNLQKEYNLSLNEQLRLQTKLQENVFLKDYVGRVKDGMKALHEASNKYNEGIIELINKGQAKTGLRKKISWKNVGKSTAGGAAAGAAIGSVVPVVGTAIGAAVGAVVGFVGGLFGGKKKVPKYAHVLREYPELYDFETSKFNVELAKQLKNGKLVNKETAHILDNLIKWNEQIEKAREQVKAVIKELAGSLSQNLKKNLVDAFKSGEDAAKAMGKTVEEVIEGILSSLIFNKIFSKAFEDLEKEMAASQDVGGDGSWLDDLSRFFETSKGLTADFNKAMAAAREEAKRRGLNIFEKTSKSKVSANSLKGAVRGMTEKQADLLAGQFGGLRLTQLDTNKILRSSHTAYMAKIGESIRVSKQIEINTRKTAENTNGMREGFKAVETAVKQRSNTMAANGI